VTFVLSSLGKSPWLIVYFPLGNYSTESYAKVFAKISSDFYFDKSGDRTVMLTVPSEDNPVNASSSMSFNLSTHGSSAMLQVQQSHNSFSDFLSKLREGIVASFQHRSALYDSDIRRLDATRGTPSFDFRQLFLVKESLALLYQMMQLSDMALAQYEELEAILPFAPVQQLPDSDWPLVAPEPFRTGEPVAEVVSPNGKEKEKDLMTDVVKNGDDVVVYSINLARMKILKSKLSILELHRYVFARQMFFLITLQRPVHCAQKGLEFLKFASNTVEKKALSLPSGVSPSIPTPSSPPNSTAANSDVIQMTSTNLRVKQAEVWTLTASIKILRVCRDLIRKIFNIENGPAAGTLGESLQSMSSVFSATRNSRTSMGSHNDMVNEDGSPITIHDDGNVMDQSFRASSMLNERILVLKESFLVLSEILEFANKQLARLTPVGRYAKALSFKLVSEFSRSYLDVTSVFTLTSNTDAAQDMSSRERRLLNNACQYFSIFFDESSKSITGRLQQELELVAAQAESSLDQVSLACCEMLKFYFIDLI
jgi:hypothetical protein